MCVCVRVYAFDVFVQKFSDCCLQVVLALRWFMIKSDRQRASVWHGKERWSNKEGE